MEEQRSKEHRLILETGDLVILHPDGPAGGFPMAAIIDRVSDGLHWILGCCDAIGCGEAMLVESPVHDDARYVTRAKVVASSPETFGLRLEPTWERVQQREFVRILAHGLQVRVLRPISRFGRALDSHDSSEDESAAALAAERDSIHDLVDVSAGGLRFHSTSDHEPDEQVVCHFELPESQAFVLPARIVRPAKVDPCGAPKSSVAVEFLGLDENTRSQLLRWVYREQVRRNRQEMSRDADG